MLPTPFSIKPNLMQSYMSRFLAPLLFFVTVVLPSCRTTAEEASFLEFNPLRPFQVRPSKNATNVSSYSTIYFAVRTPPTAQGDNINPNSIEAFLIEEGQEQMHMLGMGQKFQTGFEGHIFPDARELGEESAIAVYIVPLQPLKENTCYTVQVCAAVSDNATPHRKRDSWSFTTAPRVSDAPIDISVNFNTPSIHWQGQFFAGIMKPNYNTSKLFYQLDSYEMMAEISRRNPNIWSLQRDYSITEDFWFNGVWDGNPNLVREKETRRISHMTQKGDTTVLAVEDFYGHEQYGIQDNRPLSEDYHPGDVVLVADRHKSEVSIVRSVNEDTKTVIISQLRGSPDSWVLDYSGAIPKDIPETPGNFSLPRCYLRKFKPSGTPVYFWDRLDAEMDLVHKKLGRRLIVNFASTPTDLSENGVPGHPGGNSSPTKPKDYIEYWKFVYTVTDHIVKRYGRATQDFYYSVGNEFDLPPFWRDTQQEAHKFYDYTVDAILKAYEDNGLDPSKVKVGGLEISAIFGLHTLPEFLYHCSPTATMDGLPPINYAYADPSLNGKRSQRIEKLCRAHNGKGSPCDFTSVHLYRKSKEVAQYLIKTKELALKIDPHYYKKLYVNSFETCPGWVPLPDPAQRSIYKGNGYFPSWAADIIHRLLEKASQDKRYAFGETILTVWPVDFNGEGVTSVTGLFKINSNHNKQLDKILTVKKPIFNFIELLGKMSHDYFVIPRTEIAGYVIGTFGSKKDDSRQILLYCHKDNDIETRENRVFNVRLRLTEIPWTEVTVEQFKVDKHHSSIYEALMNLPKKDFYTESEVAHLTDLDDLQKSSPDIMLAIHKGTAELNLTVSTNGVTFVNMSRVR